jgi:hypothetical protein
MRDIPNKSTGDKFYPYECNSITAEEKNLITSAGITLSELDLQQLAKAITMYSGSGDFYTDSGIPNTYVLSVIGSKLAPFAYVNGLRVKFRPTNTCTASSTVNVCGLGVRPIVEIDGSSATQEGDIISGQVTELVYNSSSNKFELQSKTQSHGFLTGEIKFTINSTPPPGWIFYVNYPPNTTTTIGDASSGATIRANDDCEQLFKMIWNNTTFPSGNTICPIDTAPIGASADADWLAHKRINLPYITAHAFGAAQGHRLPGAREGNRSVNLTEKQLAEHHHEYDQTFGDFGSHGDVAGSSALYVLRNTSKVGESDPISVIQETVYFNVMMKL